MKKFNKFNWNKILNDATWTGEQIDNVYYIDVENVKRAIENGADIDSCDTLLWSVRCGYSNLVQYLIEHGADINQSSAGGFSLLMAAILDKEFKTAEILIKNNIDLNMKNSQNFDYYSLAFPLNTNAFIHFNYDDLNLKSSSIIKILDNLNRYIIINRYEDINYRNIDDVVAFYNDSFTEDDIKKIDKSKSRMKFKI